MKSIIEREATFENNSDMEVKVTQTKLSRAFLKVNFMIFQIVCCLGKYEHNTVLFKHQMLSKLICTDQIVLRILRVLFFRMYTL